MIQTLNVERYGRQINDELQSHQTGMDNLQKYTHVPTIAALIMYLVE